MATAKEVLATCKAELGVMERPAGSNKVKYNTWFYGRPVWGSAYAWCAVFLKWCFAHTKGANGLFPKNANAAYAQDDVVSKCGGKWIMRKTTSSAKRKAYLKKAKAGDIVDFDFGRYNAYRQHIGIVAYVKGSFVYCYEGNTSPDERGSQSNGGRVCLKARHYSMICSAARPKYDEKKIEKKTDSAKKKTKTKNTTTKAKKSVKPKIYVNAGHSNTDTGAVSKWATERDLNVKVRNAMVQYLTKHYNVEVRYNGGNLKDLKKITKIANDWKADLYVSIHFNAGGGDGWEGCLYKLDDKHERLGHVFEKHVKAIGQNSRGLKARPDLMNLNLTKMPAILNECAFVDNYNDIKKWRTDKGTKAMGEALAKAAAEYVKAEKK